MVRKRESRSAGIGDPYWYEWGVGLLKAVEMLNPDSDIDAVAFQKDGVKGWDDVVIRYHSGRKDYYQVKHSRPRTNLTFSDLVGKTNDQPSLLESLTSSWHEMKLYNTDSSCILITNRSAGTRAGRSGSGVYHPPLEKFIKHISSQVKSVVALADIKVPEKWRGAWKVWLAEMGSIADDEKLQFLKGMTITVNAPQLDDIWDRLTASLASSFQIVTEQANTLVKSLRSALYDWTTSIRGTNEWITAEDVMAELAESDPKVFGYCDVPTPVPFFPSREQAVAKISSLLTGDGEHRIVFIAAEPGSGKTSVVSRIVNQRAEDYPTRVVDLRYYAYRPITPDAPALPADADRSATPESLWYTLLSQMRERLLRRLFELKVPVRNHFITPDDARDHVLRLAGVLAREKDSPFVIAIDGIDHAARARRKGLPSLLGSMPAPETVPERVRLLIAGQPASAYPEYPIWLKSEDDLVVQAGLSPVDTADIQLLLSDSSTGIDQEEQEHAARVVQGVADGNTLATVFSVAEAETCTTLTELEARLSERKLHSGVHAYYTEIWQSAVPDSPAGLGAYLSSVLCFLRERITGEMMQEAFPVWEKPAPEWNAILKKLEPLVVCDADGYRVRHNDIRVFLEQELRADETSMQQVTSLLADYYIGASADPFFRQQSLFFLLQLAGRERDKARIFTPNWVLDAAAYGRELSAVYEEAEDAFRAIPEVKEWEVALSVACGGMTLTKLADCLDAFPGLLDHISMPQPPLPQCLATERFVLPFNQWDNSTIRQVLNDVRLLADRGETDRARGLIKNWFTDVSPVRVMSEVKGMTDSFFEDWGALSFRLGTTVRIETPTENVHQQAIDLFEKGWVSECINRSGPDSICASLKDFKPRSLKTFKVAAQEAAKKSFWGVVATLLDTMKKNRYRLDLRFRIKAAYWALKAIGQEEAKEWLEVLADARSGKSNDTRIEMPSMIFVARSIGWIEPQRDASAIASELADAITGQGHNVCDRSPLLHPLRAAAMVGLVERMLSKGNVEKAAALVPAPAISSVIKHIWEHRNSLDSLDSLEYRGQALELTFELIRLCQDIGDAHGEMVLALAISEGEKFPVDQTMPVLWEVLRRSGQRDLLHKWAGYRIGPEGVAWSGLSYSKRAETVGDFSRLCRAEGWSEMAEAAEDRLRHHVIGYSSHKDYSFQEPLDWIEELFFSEASAWREEGLHLLDICRECEDQEGDNRLSSEIENEVATAAFRCGPDSAYEFFNWIDPEVERYYWLQTVRATTISASRRTIAEHLVIDHTDILALWCCAVGLTRWFERYQAQTVTALRDTILSAVGPKFRQHIADQMRDLTPGEFLREEYDRDRYNSGSSGEETAPVGRDSDVITAVAELAQKIDEGYEPNLMEIGRLAMRLAQENPSNRVDLMRKLFGLIDANRDYVTSWRQPHPLKEMIPFLREDEIWELMQRAVQATDKAYRSSWMSRNVHLICLYRNVHLICLYRAAAEGSDRLRKGTQSLLAMHRLWAGIPESQVPDEKKLSVASSIDTWPRFVTAVLQRLLSADSAETVSAALRGLCAVVEIAPQAVSELFADSEGLQRSRLLLGAEVWAARQPLQFTALLEDLWNRREGLCFSDRIQLWICSLAAAQVERDFKLSDTFMPEGFPVPGTNRNPILTKPKRLLEIGSKIQGSTRLANAYSAARTLISRLGKITGCDTDNIEAAIAEGLDAQIDETDGAPNRNKKKHFATEDGDMVINCGVDSILNKALLQELRRPRWTDRDAGDVAMAVTHGDDPWIIRRSPLPSPAGFDWPDQKEVDEWLVTKTDKADILNRLRLLASGGNLASHQQVLGSSLRVFTSHYDLEMWYWLEAKQSEDVVRRNAPLCPSGRSFQFFLPDRFEPRVPDRVPLVFFSGSLLCLSFSTLEVVPSRVLQDHLGCPKSQNPLEWVRDGRVVAKYETYHGPLDYNRERRHMRQPTLARWVVNTEDIKELGSLSPKWDHKSIRFQMNSLGRRGNT